MKGGCSDHTPVHPAYKSIQTVRNLYMVAITTNSKTWTTVTGRQVYDSTNAWNVLWQEREGGRECERERIPAWYLL
jgi:hypothetical protein